MDAYAQVRLGVERMPAGPWVYGRLVDDYHPHRAPDSQGTPEDGSIVELIDLAGRFCGHGLYNSRSDIRVRVLSRGRRTDLDRPREFFERRIASAIRLRRKVLRLDGVTDAYRLVHAEGDDLPGLIVDKLGDALVCQYHSLGFWRLRSLVEDVLRALLAGHSIVHRFAQSARGPEGFPDSESGEDGELPEERFIQEHGVRFLVRPGASHKTGWFCDQRDNRRRIAGLVEGRHVLDLCCHAGGFAIPAALSGARSVLAVDLDEEPIARAQASARENRLENVEFRHADAFNVLRDAIETRRRPGLVILDPHKLAKGKRDLEQAKVKYRDLNSLGLEAVAPGGLLATFSCSGALDLGGFAGLVFQAARRAEREVRLLEVLGASPDHPQRPDFGRSRYLKGLLLAVD